MKLAFACPFYGNTPPLVNDSFRANIINAQEAGHTFVDDYSVSNTQHRNACDAMAFRASLDDRIDAVFWTEHDCVLPPHAISMLAESLEKTPEADMIAGVVFRRCEPYNPMIAKLDTNFTLEQYEEMKKSPDRTVQKAAALMSYDEMKNKVLVSTGELDTSAEPFPIDTASLNCVLFRRDVFVKTKDVPDLFAVDQNGFFSIDNAFFLRLKDMGLKLYCDPRVLCGHLSEPEVITVSHWMKYTNQRAEAAEIKHIQHIRKTRGLNEVIHGELTRLANFYKTDKGTLEHDPSSGWYGWVHGYCDFYQVFLEPIRLTATKVMEIGVWHGASLRMWHDYFPAATIIGVEKDLAVIEGEFPERVKVIQGDQKSREDLSRIASEEGPFDLIVDDGSHFMDDQQITLGTLFPHIKPGGWYILEDVHTSFLRGTPQGEMYSHFGLREDRSNATVNVLYALAKKEKPVSEYMTEEEIAYLHEHVDACYIYGRRSMTAMIRKKL